MSRFVCFGTKVGKSYGKLDGKEREKYEQLNCNSVAKSMNPSCDDVNLLFVSFLATDL